VGPGFLSAVFPFRSNRWVVAGFRHELVRVDRDFFSTGVFQQLPGDLTSQRDFPQEGIREVSITSYGTTVGWTPRPNVAIGAGLSVYRFSIDSVFRRFDTVGFLGPPTPAVELRARRLRRRGPRALPGPERLTAILRQRLASDDIPDRLVAAALRRFMELRETPGLEKKPATAEIIMWVKVLHRAGVDVSRIEAAGLGTLPHKGALIKTEHDLRLLERTAG